MTVPQALTGRNAFGSPLRLTKSQKVGQRAARACRSALRLRIDGCSPEPATLGHPHGGPSWKATRSPGSDSGEVGREVQGCPARRIGGLAHGPAGTHGRPLAQVTEEAVVGGQELGVVPEAARRGGPLGRAHGPGRRLPGDLPHHRQPPGRAARTPTRRRRSQDPHLESDHRPVETTRRHPHS